MLWWRLPSTFTVFIYCPAIYMPCSLYCARFVQVFPALFLMHHFQLSNSHPPRLLWCGGFQFTVISGVLFDPLRFGILAHKKRLLANFNLAFLLLLCDSTSHNSPRPRSRKYWRCINMKIYTLQFDLHIYDWNKIVFFRLFFGWTLINDTAELQVIQGTQVDYYQSWLYRMLHEIVTDFSA